MTFSTDAVHVISAVCGQTDASFWGKPRRPISRQLIRAPALRIHALGVDREGHFDTVRPRHHDWKREGIVPDQSAQIRTLDEQITEFLKLMTKGEIGFITKDFLFCQRILFFSVICSPTFFFLYFCTYDWFGFFFGGGTTAIRN
ncbi:hypothetical protein AVEN_5357-1 [Araneus ventricosus]|uniref:Uncharacterized protein n=1 Tax=Araneus ventricosus TaxID=182803 RepID=A0A4Y2WTG6_ARAVE|nr:hypothetical protein AVEN_5357-1 [Araneus ventricosus]